MTSAEPPVSRETGPPSDEAVQLFSPDRLGLAGRYVELLAGPGVDRGLIGPREAPRLWDRHVVNCALVAQVVPVGASVADLGSGAGLPGIVLSLVRPDLTVLLVEPLLRRTTFLTEVVAELGLQDRIGIWRGRADELAGRETFDVVTARALAPLERLLGWAMPLVAASGELVAMKGSSASREVAAASAALQRLHCAAPRVQTVEGPAGLSTVTLVRVAHGDAARVS